MSVLCISLSCVLVNFACLIGTQEDIECNNLSPDSGWPIYVQVVKKICVGEVTGRGMCGSHHAVSSALCASDSTVVFTVVVNSSTIGTLK